MNAIARVFPVILCVASSASPAAAGDGRPVPPLPVASQILLVDDTVLAGRLVSCDEGSVMVENLDLGLVTLPRRAVVGWRAGLASDRTLEARPVALAALARVESSATAALLLDNDDVVVVSAIAVSGPTATVAVIGRPDPVALPMERVRAIDFVHEPSRRPEWPKPEITLVALRDGSRLAVERRRSPMEEAGQGRVRLALATPHAESLAVEIPRDGIVSTTDRGAEVRSLEHEPLSGFGGRDPGDLPIGFYVRSRSLSGGPLRARGEHAFGGFSMQGPGSAHFLLRPPADRFEGRVAIDDAAAGAVTIRVTLRAGMLARGTLAEAEFGPIRGGDPPRAISLDAPGMETLEIEVHADGDDWKQARVLWLDPVVITTHDGAADD